MSATARPDPGRVAALFDDLADRDPDDAARRLAEACGDDRALHDAVARLLAHDRAAAGFLAGTALEIAATRTDAALCETVPVEAGVGAGAAISARVGRFYVLHKLGEGGMGVVYVGYDEALDRRVALKLLHRGAATSEWLKREGQALGRLAHPHVVGVHEIGEHEGRVFLAMELVEGPTLRAWLAETPRPFLEIASLFVQAGRGLAAAHAAGLVHRDFKPENVLVAKDGRARVVDFGIAALAVAEARTEPTLAPSSAPGESPSLLASPLTQAGSLVGTPAFMAPEQLRGERATPASDQWAFAVALYRAAYGSRPFPVDDFVELLRHVAERPPAPPPRVAGVPAWLAPIVLRALEKEPAARFPSMDAMIAELLRHLPRDPDLDPEAVRRERRALAGVLLLASIVIPTLLFSLGERRSFASGWTATRIAAGICLGLLAVITALRRRLATNLYGRRIAAMLLTASFAMLVHRTLGALIGMPLAHVLLEDQLILATTLCLGAITVESWFAWNALAFVVGACVTAFAPAWAAVSFGVTACLMTATLAVKWGRRG
jgi:serine/threonine-protein kinase